MKRKNAIVGQSGGPTAAINATLAGLIRAALAADGIDLLYGMQHGIEGLLEGNTVVLNTLFSDSEKINLLAQTPAAALGSCRRKLPDPHGETCVFEQLFAIFEEYEIGYFFYIGGNDSMDTIQKLSEYAEAHDIHDICFIGVPKTIDNDLVMTDHTPGYGSSAKYIATSVAEIVRDCAVYTVPAVTIVEIMGRDAGWLTASAALAGRICGQGVDYIYLPEADFSDARLFEDIEKALAVHPNVVIAVSEGLRYADGIYVGEAGQNGVFDAFGHRYLSGVGKVLEQKIRDRFGCKVRSVEINILQRCAAHLLSATDIHESLQTGANAVCAALSGESGVMICMRRKSGALYQTEFFCAPVRQIANKIRKVPAEYQNKQKNQVTEDCMDYMLPLIQGEFPLCWKNGLPVHFVLK